jgi:hypothetical protein
MGHKAIISPAIIERLLGVDTSYFSIPSFRKKKGLTKDTWYLKNIRRFVLFCKEMDMMNQQAGLGFVVGRALEEAAWCKAVIAAYKKMYVFEFKLPSLNALRVVGYSNSSLSNVPERVVHLE